MDVTTCSIQTVNNLFFTPFSVITVTLIPHCLEYYILHWFMLNKCVKALVLTLQFATNCAFTFQDHRIQMYKIYELVHLKIRYITFSIFFTRKPIMWQGAVKGFYEPDSLNSLAAAQRYLFLNVFELGSAF